MYKSETGQFQLSNSSIDLTSLLEGVACTLAGRAVSRGLEVIAFTGASVPAWIQADGRALRRILLSLGKFTLENAGGEDVVLYAEIDKRAKSSPSIRFYISGICADILPEDHPATFEDLLHAEYSDGVNMSSLTLAAAEGLARLMGNGVRLTPSPAKGYVFTFEIKLNEAPAQTASEPVSGLKGARLLIVDDNPVNRQALTKMLESLGCKATAVANGAEVLPILVRGLLSNSSFRMVLLDLQMPGINGEEVLLAIRQHKLAKDTKVVMLVPSGQSDKSNKAYNLGCSGVLAKPIRRVQLREMVEFTLGLRLDTPNCLKPPRIEEPIIKTDMQKLNILLAEDDVLSQQIASLQIARLGLSVDLVFNGAEALAAAKTRDYDLILMDMQMPVMNGPEAAREIRKLEGEKKNVTIIAMTASDIKEAEQRCLEAGMNGYITKPLDIKRLSQVIRACMEGHYQKRPKLPTAPLPDSSPIEAPMLDVPAVLPVFANDLNRYRGFLDEFLRSLPGRLELIEAAYDAGDWKALEREAHTLKGVAATLGATKLSKLASRLDIQVKDQQSESIATTIHDIHVIITMLIEKAKDLVPARVTQELRFKTRVLCAPS